MGRRAPLARRRAADPERDLRAGDGGAAPPRRGARVRAHHRRRDPGQPRARRSRTAATAWSTAGRGTSRGSSPRSRRRATSATTRWSRSSTSGSGCSRSCPAGEAFRALDAVRGRGVRTRGSSARSSTATVTRPLDRARRVAVTALLEPAGRDPRALARTPGTPRSASSAATASRPSTAGGAARTPCSSPACGRGSASTRPRASPVRDRAREERALPVGAPWAWAHGASIVSTVRASSRYATAPRRRRCVAEDRLAGRRRFGEPHRPRDHRLEHRERVPGLDVGEHLTRVAGPAVEHRRRRRRARSGRAACTRARRRRSRAAGRRRGGSASRTAAESARSPPR